MQFWKNNAWLRRAAWIAAGLLGLWLVAWLGVPPLLRYEAQKIASEKLGRTVTIGAVDFKPWSLELTIHDLAVAGAGGQGEQLRVQRFYIDAELQSLLRWAPVADAIEVDAPVIHIARTADGHYDFDDVLARLAPTPGAPPSQPLHFVLYNIKVQGGAVEFRDALVARTHTLSDLEFAVPFVSNLASQREVKVAPRLAFKLDGSSFDSAAQTTPFADDRKADATLRLTGLDLAAYAAYLPASVPVRLQAGVLDADLRLVLEQQPALVVRLSGTVQAHGVRLADRAGGDLLSFDGLRVAIADFAPLARTVRLDSVQWDGPRLRVQRDRAGRLNLALGEEDAAKPATAASTAPAAPDWKVAVAKVAVQRAAIAWTDEQVPGGAYADVDALSLHASQIAWPFAQPLQFAGAARLAAGTPGAKGAAEPARLAFSGQATDRMATVAASLQGLALEGAAPYLAQQLKPRLGGMLDADLGLAWNGPAVVVQVAALSLHDLRLACATDAACGAADNAIALPRNTLADWKQLRVEDAQVDLLRQRVHVGKITLAQPRVLAARGADGRWMFDDWRAAAPPADAPDPQAVAPASVPWDLRFGDIAVEGGAVGLRDAAAAAPVAFSVTALQLRLQDFAPLAAPGAKPSPLQVAARIVAGRTEPGRLAYEGTLGLAPLSAAGRVQAGQIPLHAFVPYVADALNLDIRRADGSFKGEVWYADAPAGPSLRVRGDAAVDDMRAYAVAGGGVGARPARLRGLGAGNDLLNWKSLALRGVDVALAPRQPLAVDVRETVLSDFFARIVVQETGRLNLQDLVKQDTAAAPAPSTAPAAAQPAPPPERPQPVIRFGPVAAINGTVAFADHFVKPNYSADITELTGRLSAFSSQTPAGSAEPLMADLELRGRAEGTASLEVTGKLNPLAKPLALDIQGRMRDLELPALSPYTIKYAGHGIERGKMSMDVAYKVLPDGQLTASNRLILNQLTFGEPVQGAPASLPVKLAVALLADRNGVIDVDLPISGSLNDPDFRLGSVILRVIGNLIVKAVTSPFSLIVGAFGGGDSELNSVDFAPGSAALDDAARGGLDKVAHALADRPQLMMTVVGEANLAAERDAWKRERLKRLLLAEKRRAATRAGQDTAQLQAVTPAEAPALLKEVYRRADIAKPRNIIGIAKDIPDAEMESLLLASIPLPDDAMQALAVARGVAVRDYLAQQQLPLDRLFLGAARVVPDGDKGTGQWKPHAQLSLGTR
ncbi:DUF748 domain-containing protein [Ramlibacter sp. H39-3-26]|uniref:DUF748 domain-containing protein n=1 Tax=Curvibacter soli TaxID=3031331 RepID=UPI0023DB6F54|nr:DUF748 domain-containing protein [Ramlibacter sp. H39-3-26]MDF1486204.1 DUF748 domain-containing protein [Ramlibacter sp. H39-3-26]